jgi:hypothetical protein
MKISKKRLFTTMIVILLILSPFALLLNPVLKKFQERNNKYHQKLVEKQENDKDVSEQWDNLKFRQKLIGDIYRYTFRERSAVNAYETYLDWFRDSWKTKHYVQLKMDTASLCRKLYSENPRLREYRLKAACHFQEIVDWYEGEGDAFRKFVRESSRAISTFDLRRFTDRCD